MLNKDLLSQFLEAIKQDVIAEQQRQNKIASGESIRSYEVVTEGNELYTVGQLKASNYWDFIENGRGPGKFPPLERIQQWIKEKGIESDLRKIKSLAYVIGKKIAEKGTNQYDQGPAGLLMAATESRLEAFQTLILENTGTKIQDDLVYEFGKRS